MNNKVVIGGNLKLKNVVSGQAKLNNVISGTPNTSIRAGGRGGISNAVKEALLDCFEHVAWIDDDGQVYYQALYDALYPKVLVSITAVFNQGQAVIYDTDTLDDLTQYLTVIATYDDSSTATIASTEYTLSGTLTPGTSTITVTYKSKATTFNVTVTHMPGTVTITNNLTGCTTSNAAASGTEGASYSATITASSGYSLTGATVSITMGGTDITSTAYNNGTISIAELTGNLVITITAVAVTLSSISAVYTQSGTVYTTDSLDSLKSDLVVTATYSDSSTATVPSADYTLSGTLAVGTSTITVTYGGKTSTFNVTVSEAIIYVENGTIATADGTESSNAKRARTDYVPVTSRVFTMSAYANSDPTNVASYALRYYDTNHNYIGNSQGPHTVPKASGTDGHHLVDGWLAGDGTEYTDNTSLSGTMAYVRFVFRKTTDSDITHIDGTVTIDGIEYTFVYE